MDLLYIIVIVLVVMWLGGFSTKVGGKLIHLLLVLAVIILLFRLLT